MGKIEGGRDKERDQKLQDERGRQLGKREF